MADRFSEIRQQISAADAARAYGIFIGRNGMACCPFHSDHTPSCSFKGRYFHCFGCGAGGDAIEFAARLFGISRIDSAKKINVDFCLGLPFGQPLSPAEREKICQRKKLRADYQAFESWRVTFFRRLGEAYRRGALVRGVAAAELSSSDTAALRWHAELGYAMDLLGVGNFSEQIGIYRNREVLDNWVGKILNAHAAG